MCHGYGINVQDNIYADIGYLRWESNPDEPTRGRQYTQQLQTHKAFFSESCLGVKTSVRRLAKYLAKTMRKQANNQEGLVLVRSYILREHVEKT